MNPLTRAANELLRSSEGICAGEYPFDLHPYQTEKRRSQIIRRRIRAVWDICNNDANRFRMPAHTLDVAVGHLLTYAELTSRQKDVLGLFMLNMTFASIGGHLLMTKQGAHSIFLQSRKKLVRASSHLNIAYSGDIDVVASTYNDMVYRR